MKVDPGKLQRLVNKVIAFNKARGWQPVSEDIAKSIVIESAELLELFQWGSRSKGLGTKEERDWSEAEAELADILWYIITFCHATGIDPFKALEEKLKHNEKKWPEAMFKGKHNEKFYREQKRKYRSKK